MHWVIYEAGEMSATLRYNICNSLEVYWKITLSEISLIHQMNTYMLCSCMSECYDECWEYVCELILVRQRYKLCTLCYPINESNMQL